MSLGNESTRCRSSTGTGFSLRFRYRADTQTYQPYNKDWIKEKIYVLLRRQAQQASKWKASGEHGGVLTIVFTCVWTCVGGCSMTIYISDEGEEDLNSLLSIKVSFQRCVCGSVNTRPGLWRPLGCALVHTAQAKTLVSPFWLVFNLFGCCHVSRPPAGMQLSDADELE